MFLWCEIRNEIGVGKIIQVQAVETAKHLIGAVLVHESKGRNYGEEELPNVKRMEEFYRGKPDDGAHSYKGLTPRTQAIFGEGGHIYVYMIYGMYWCMNVVCGHEGDGYAVLLRALEPLEGKELMEKRRGKARGKGCLPQAPVVLQWQWGLINPFMGPIWCHGSVYIEDGKEKVRWNGPSGLILIMPGMGKISHGGL